MPIAMTATSRTPAERTRLSWLPEPANWAAVIKDLEADRDEGPQWDDLVAAARLQLDFIRTDRLDRTLHRSFGSAPPGNLATKSVRLAVLGSSTLAQLLPAIRIAALRRGIWLQTYEAGYGQSLQEFLDPQSGLHAFGPTAVLFAFDTLHTVRGADPNADAARATQIHQDITGHLRQLWTLARQHFKCHILQQTFLPVSPALLGSNEQRLPGSAAAQTRRLNAALRDLAEEEGFDLVAIDDFAAETGLSAWHDPVLWHRGKQEISPEAAPLYGDLVGRLLAAKQGRSAKCLVLDLDNTLWGGVIGEDGLDGIVLGQGSALGEAFTAFQSYARDLARRGVILAVCSKNDEANAFSPFDQHPDMVLRRDDIACFVANWADKASNIREIARKLNIGLDSLVFADDNPFERNLIRQELPMVSVPEVPNDPALFAKCISDAGYFEGLGITNEDKQRTHQYRTNEQRETLQNSVTDLVSYLRSLEMELLWRRFDQVGLNRVVQLVNKTNQFNLTTRRYTEDDISTVRDDARSVGLQLRLTDRFGDNGIIAVVIGRMLNESDLLIDTWLMSCRVLGRQVEEATLLVLTQQADLLGAKRLLGEYRPTAKNGIVRDHYAKLGFATDNTTPEGFFRSVLDLTRFKRPSVLMAIKEER